MVYAADGAGHLRAVDLTTGKPPATWKPPDYSQMGKGISSIVASPDGRTLYLGFGVWHDEATANTADGLEMANS